MPRRLGAGAEFLIVNNREAFLERYPESAAFVAGEFKGNLSNRGETIIVEDIYGRLITEVSYEDRGEWVSAADGDGYSLEFMGGSGSQADPTRWVASETLRGSPVRGGGEVIRISQVKVVAGDIVLTVSGLQAGGALVQKTLGVGKSEWETIGTFEGAEVENEIRLPGPLGAEAVFYRVLVP